MGTGRKGNGDAEHVDVNTTLGQEDGAALDALVSAGFDPELVEPTLRERARRVAALLGLLDTEPAGSASDRSSLAERVVGTVRTAQQREAVLDRDSDEALEAFVMSGYDAVRTPSGVRRAARAHETAHELITELGPENEQWISAGRIVRTESVMSAISESAAPTMLEQPRRVRSFRMADLLAAAAAILLVSAFTLPVMSAFTEDGKRRVCTANLQAAGAGLGMYTLSNDDALPMATAGFGGGWAQVGRPGQSHSANLYTLVRTRHVQPWELACPGNESAPRGSMDRDAGDWSSLEEVSYSYRFMPKGRSRVDSLDGDSILLADRSPILLAAMAGRRVSPEASSPNHGREGQHMLRLGGAVVWSGSPVLPDGDNIWLPRSVERALLDVRKKFGYFEGSELPETPDDTFLGP